LEEQNEVIGTEHEEGENDGSDSKETVLLCSLFQWLRVAT
jgi:hypothetical protein